MERKSRVLAVLLLLLLLPGLAGGCSPTSLKRRIYEGGDRDTWQQPEKVVAALALAPGDRVADLGAGSGYFTFRLADAVGPEGRVYAVDVDAGMIDYVAQRAAETGAANVEPVLAEPADPRLPAGGIDLVFTSNTYHHLGERPAYFARLRPSLRPQGRVAVVEFLPGGFFQWLFPHSTEPERIEAEMAEAGYTLVERHDFLERQSFLVFAPAPQAGAGP